MYSVYWLWRALLRLVWLVVAVVAIIQAYLFWPLSWGWAAATLALSVVVLFSASPWENGASLMPANAPFGRSPVGGAVEWILRPFAGAGVGARFWFGGIAVAAIALMVVAWRIRAVRPIFFDQGPPSTIDNPLDRRHFPDLLRYATSLRYDTDTSHLSRLARDRQFLALHDPEDPEAPGPLATIIPVIDSHLNRLRDLEGIGNGKGRVVAMVEVEAQGYPPLNLPAGRSYIFLDDFKRRDQTARALIIPDNPQDSVRQHVVPVRYHRHRREWQHHSRARWLWRGHHCANMDGCPHGCCDMCGQQE